MGGVLAEAKSRLQSRFMKCNYYDCINNFVFSELTPKKCKSTAVSTFPMYHILIPFLF